MIRILLVDDQTTICQALQVLLAQQPDFQVVGTAPDGYLAIEKTAALRPNVVLIDIQMPGLDGVAATRIISQRFPDTKVLVLSTHDDEQHLQAALRAGAQGYLLKTTGAEDLAIAIRATYRGYSQLSPGLFKKILQAEPEPTLSSAEPSPLQQSVFPDADLLLVLHHFDPQALTEILRQTLQKQANLEMRTYLEQFLKQYPTNLSALYLVGALAMRSLHDTSLALNYLRFGFNEGIQQRLSPDNLLLFYREAVVEHPNDAFAWLTQPDSPWLQEPDLSFLVAEATERFGCQSSQYQWLQSLRQIRALQTVHQTCQALVPRIQKLEQGFVRLNAALQSIPMLIPPLPGPR